MLATRWSLIWAGDGSGGVGYTALRSHGFGSSSRDERLAADTVGLSRGGGGRIVGWQEENSNLLLLDRRFVGLLDV
jgi:hypothetical protein